MNKITFIFISCFFLLLALYSGVTELNGPEQVIPAVAFIALLGIPHGAIDHILFLEKSKWSPLAFYAFYLGMVGIYVVAWLYFPALSMLLFLLLSAYHFGQSQLVDIDFSGKWRRMLIYFSWGASILSALIVYNQVEIVNLSKGYEEMQLLLPVMSETPNLIVLIACTALVVILLAEALVRKRISGDRFAMELFLLFVIHFSFLALPILTAFSLYFVILHSLKVLSDEYKFLSRSRKRLWVKKFIHLLWPYTLLSLIGTAIILGLSYAEWIEVSQLFLVFILISVLTLPHSIVMEKFYQTQKS